MANTSRHIAWQLSMQAILLLVIHGAMSLMTAVKFLPVDPLTDSLPYMQASGFSNVMLELAMLTGLIGIAIYYQVSENTTLLSWMHRLWTVAIVLIVIAGLLNILQGTHLRELPFALAIFLIVLVLGWIFVLLQSPNNEGKWVILSGLGFVVIAGIVGIVPADNPLTDRILRAVTVNTRFFIAYPLGALAIFYWRQNIDTLQWNASVIAIIGAIASITSLNAIGLLGLPGWLMAIVIVIGMVFVLHTLTGSGYAWSYITAMLWGVGFAISALLIIPEIGQHIAGTRLADVQVTFMSWGVWLLIIGHATDHMKQRFQYAPIWLLSIGLAISLGTLITAGVVQIFMERLLGIGYLDTQNALVPVYMMWIIGLLVLSVGVIVLTYQMAFARVFQSPPDVRQSTE